MRGTAPLDRVVWRNELESWAHAWSREQVDMERISPWLLAMQGPSSAHTTLV